MTTTKKKVLMIGTLDTKGEQLDYLRERIRSRGHETLLIDLSTGTEPQWKGDITAEEIAASAGRRLSDLMETKDRAVASEAMEVGTERKVLELFSRNEFDGIVSLGGVTVTNIASRVMRKLPFGVPKVIGVSAIMPVFLTEWLDAIDIVAVQMIMELRGMNDLLKSVIERLAGTVCGLVEDARPYNSLRISPPSVAITEYGFCQNCPYEVRRLLEEKGYSVFSFHAQGISDRAMERLISQGFFDGVIDIVVSGLSDELTQGNRAAGKERLDAASKRGLPQVLAPAGINMTGCGPSRRNRERYEGRQRVLKMDELRSMTRYTTDELRAHAKIYAEKLNKAKAPGVFLFPRKGWSSADREGSVLYAPEEDKVFIEELKRHLKSDFEIQEIDCHLEDPEFAEALVSNFERLFNRAKGGSNSYA